MVNYFFKVVLHEALRDGKLKIPPKFVRTNGKSLEDSKVVLEGRVDGEEWEVKLEKHGGKVWLGEGWKEFANHYFIKLGHFLVFKYKENSGHFRVDIFDETATEIEFHSTNRRTTRKSTTEQPPVAVGKTKKATHTAAGISKGTTYETRMPSKAGTSTGTPDVETMPSKGGKIKSTKRFKQAMDMDIDQKATATQRAEVFKSKNPFFWISLSPTYVVQRYMNIPKKFFENHLRDKSTNVILKNSKGGTWLVQYVFKIVEKKPIGKFCTGWNKFVRDNNVQVGDVCLFELIKGQQISFRVRIFPTP
ncbi:B3 domain-containing transcription factor VRN1 isoform X1 [Ziziphus jujuba]|uniref:B3 domain-containing transcription factor VRN1 isoform X1 n=1 Tax=Ziziphus jujuba TaxID=326968 RepID=A0ABM3ISA2_ZIZJJ|nr:B3 domain-containing transcription factor VRN1 isoform X1 [Ziziphus jujuba]